MNNNTSDKEQLIAKYLNGEFTSEDEKILFSWISESAENKKLFLGIKDTWDASLKTTLKETEQLLLFYKKQASKKTRKLLPVWIYGAAAAVLVIGLLIGGIIQQDFSNQFGQVESYFVPQGSRSELELADGTKIKLNANSRLEISPDFSANNRVVTLKGEGFFEVTSDKKHPFTVKTDNFDVLVTGTKFNISSYSDDQKISATLAEGRIQLSTKNDKHFILKPGEKISFNQETMDHYLEQADVESEIAWVDGEFIFWEIPFPDLIKRLERWYDVKLNYQSSELNSMVYSGRFKNQETIWQVLDALKLTTPIDYDKKNFREFELIYQPM